MKKCICVLILLTLFLLSCFKPTENDKTGKIKGIVRDAVSMLPLTSVSVSIADGASVTTNSNGEYTIDALNPQNYVLHFVKTGYLDNTTSVNVTAGKTTQKDIQLIPIMPELVANNTFINFGTQLTTGNIVLSNTGTGQINWTLANSEDWLHANPTSGSITDGTSPIALSVDRSGIIPGNYSTSLVITSNSNSVTIGILMTIPSTNSPLLTITPTLLDFGVNSTSSTLNLSNNGTGTSSWTLSSSQSWIGFSPSTGTTNTETDQAGITVNRTGLQSGSYNGTVNVVSNSGNITIPIAMEVTQQPVIAIDASSLDFEETLTSLTVGIANIGNGSLNWTASDNADWMTIQPTSGTGNASLTVNVNRTGLAGGNYTGNILISSNGGNCTVSVNMVVTSNLPDGVTLLSAEIINSNTAQLNWTRFVGSGFVSYRVYRATSASISHTNGTLVTEITVSNSTTCNDTGLQPQTQYYYRVYVKNNQNQMLPSTNVLSVTTPPALGQWYATQTISGLQAVDCFNLNFGMAIGSAIYSYSGDSWVQDNDNSGNDIVVISPTCVYTDDDYYNGVTWTSSGYNGDCVTGIDPNHIWVGGYSGMVRFYNGTSWSETDLDYGSIVSIDAQQSNAVYAIDYYGKIIKYNGIGWSQIYQVSEAPSGNQDYFVTDIKVVSNGEFWVTLQANYMSKGLIYRFTNDGFASKWTTDAGVTCVDALSSNDVWFAGYSGSIWHFDGNSMLNINSPCTYNLNGIKMIDSSNGWAVGSNGVLRYARRGAK